MLESLISKIIANSGLDRISDSIKFILENRLLEYITELHKESLTTKTILHRDAPRSFLELYEPLFIRRKDTGQKQSSESFKEVIEKNHAITIIGIAGCGKTTIIKYFLIRAIQEEIKIPIKVELRKLSDYRGGLLEYIREEIFLFSKLSISPKHFDKLMGKGLFVFFFDGYDEIISSKFELVANQVDQIRKEYNNNYYVLTSRPHSGAEFLPGFHNYEVCKLTSSGIKSFISKQLEGGEKELRDRLIEEVENIEGKEYRDFLMNPLLLSMFILTYQHYAYLPLKITSFYFQVFEALFSLHDSRSKLGFKRIHKTKLSKEDFLRVIGVFAFISIIDEKYIYSYSYITKRLKSIANKYSLDVNEVDDLVYDLVVNIGIIVKDGGLYLFPHKSLQEFFAAYFVNSQSSIGKEVASKKIIEKLFESSKGQVDYVLFFDYLKELNEVDYIGYFAIPFLTSWIKYSSVSRKALDANQSVDYFERFERLDELQSRYSAHLGIEPEEVDVKSLISDHFLEMSYENDRKVRFDSTNRLVIEKLLPLLRRVRENMKDRADKLKEVINSTVQADENLLNDL